MHNTIFDTYAEAARALGRVHDDNEYVLCLQEADQFSTAKDLRQLFTTLVLNGAPAPPLWEHFQLNLSSDFSMTTTPESSFNAALKDIDLKLSKHGSSTEQYGLPQVTHDSTEYDRQLRAFDTSHQIKLAADLTPQLTTEQNSIFKTLTSSELLNQGAIYIIDSSADTGKTFTVCAITAFLTGQGQLVLCSASTGIAALIFPGGLIAHSTFKFPFGDAAVEGSTCNIQERIRTRPCPPTSRAYNLR